MSDSPIDKLLRDLKPFIERHESAKMASQRYPEFPEVVRKAKIQVISEELAIEDLIRTWVEDQPIQVRKLRSDDDDQPDS